MKSLDSYEEMKNESMKLFFPSLSHLSRKGAAHRVPELPSLAFERGQFHDFHGERKP
jgi:hypothetical protein